MQTSPANTAAPAHLKAVLANNIGYFSGCSMDLAAKQNVLQVCAISASANSTEWVDLIKSWGFDLDVSPLVSLHQVRVSQSWLWYALARGKLAQAVALVEAGARRMDVNDQGVSGLGMLIKENIYFSFDLVLPLLKSLESHGLGWQNWPDADAMNDAVLKARNISLGELLSQYDARCISISTHHPVQEALPVRL